jgi:hypothetical protein
MLFVTRKFGAIEFHIRTIAHDLESDVFQDGHVSFDKSRSHDRLDNDSSLFLSPSSDILIVHSYIIIFENLPGIGGRSPDDRKWTKRDGEERERLSAYKFCV